MWAIVWAVLVVATLVGAALLGRRLWRSAVALGREVARAGEVAERFSDEVTRLEELAASQRPAAGTSLGQDPAPLAARVDELRASRRARATARRDRHRETVRRATGRWYGRGPGDAYAGGGRPGPTA